MTSTKTILMVDDDAVSLEVLGRFLEREGYSVVKCTEGPLAVQRARAGKTDLVLLDLGLPSPKPELCPVFDGFTVLNWLRSSPATERIPVIVLSAKDLGEAKPKSLAAGAWACFQKPAEPERLLTAIRIALDDSMKQEVHEELTFQAP
jgi:CheY-like chemotaxis protein